jgi:hypothetical protein
MRNDDDNSIFLSTRLFAAGFLVGLLSFSSVTIAAREGLAMSSCPTSVPEIGNSANQTLRTGIVHRISLDLFSLSITVQGRLPFVFEYKCDGKDSGVLAFTNHEYFRSYKSSESSVHAEFRNHLSDHATPSPKTSSLAEESQNRKIETNEAQPSQWQWTHGVSDIGSFSVKYFKNMCSEAKDRNHHKKMRDMVWHYKYGSGRLDKTAKVCSDRKQNRKHF